MSHLLIASTLIKMRREVLVVLVVMGMLFLLPIVALISVTDISELSDPGKKLYTGPASITNTYEYGYCTFWTAKRREEVGLPIPNNWGDAHTWDDRSALAGYRVDKTPEQYSIMEIDSRPLGHVAFVEEVHPDGTWEISEMNVKGWDVLSTRTFKASDAQRFNFIH
jgi:peptidoglycan DL-endopeptidase LytE